MVKKQLTITIIRGEYTMNFKKAEMEIVNLSVEDIVTTSGGSGDIEGSVTTK